MKEKLHKVIRIWMLIPLGIFATVLIGYFLLFFDFHLKVRIEQLATLLNGAEVNIRSLKTSFVTQTVQIQGIQVGHHVQPDRNLVEIENLSFHFMLKPLFRKKLIIDNLSITGIKLESRRGEVAKIPTQIEFAGVPSLLDRVASGFYGQIRRELRSNPLKYLGQLLVGLDLDQKVLNVQGRLSSVKELRNYRQHLSGIAKEWEALRRSTASPAWINQTRLSVDTISPSTPDSRKQTETILQDIRLEQEKILAATQKLHASYATELQKITNFQKSIVDDVGMIKDQLQIPKLDKTDLTGEIAGPELLNYLERLTYWIDLFRRRMPKNLQRGTLPIVKQAANQGASYYFGKSSAYPAFLLSQATIKSEASLKEGYGEGFGDVDGTILGLTTEPAIFGYPLKINFRANFPERQINGVNVSITVDHTGTSFVEDLVVSIGSYPIRNFPFCQTGDLQVGIASATASGVFKAHFDESQLNVDWLVDFLDVDYYLSSRYKLVDTTLQRILDPLYSFTIRGKVSGPLDNLRLETSSELGQQLAMGLQREFRHQLAAIDDIIRKNIVNQVDSEQRDVVARFQSLYDRNVADLREAGTHLASLERQVSARVSAHSSSREPVSLNSRRKHAVHSKK